PHCASASVLLLLQSQGKQSTTERAEASTLRIKLFEEAIVAFAAFDVRINPVRACFVVNRIAVVVVTCAEKRLKFCAAEIATPGFALITGAAGHRQAIDHVSGHE